MGQLDIPGPVEPGDGRHHDRDRNLVSRRLENDDRMGHPAGVVCMGLAALITGEPDKAADLYSKYAKCCQNQAALQAAINDIDALEQNPAIAEKRSDIRNVLKMRLAEHCDA